METTEQAANPSQPAATTTTASSYATTQELERHSSFLGYRPGIEASAEQPEPSADGEITQALVTKVQ
ncbi:MAG: hypothetical protein WA655_05755 [Candidatus Korobacteraceae bacterium]